MLKFIGVCFLCFLGVCFYFGYENSKQWQIDPKTGQTYYEDAHPELEMQTRPWVESYDKKYWPDYPWQTPEQKKAAHDLAVKLWREQGNVVSDNNMPQKPDYTPDFSGYRMEWPQMILDGVKRELGPKFAKYLATYDLWICSSISPVVGRINYGQRAIYIEWEPRDSDPPSWQNIFHEITHAYQFFHNAERTPPEEYHPTTYEIGWAIEIGTRLNYGKECDVFSDVLNMHIHNYQLDTYDPIEETYFKRYKYAD